MVNEFREICEENGGIYDNFSIIHTCTLTNLDYDVIQKLYRFVGESGVKEIYNIWIRDGKKLINIVPLRNRPIKENIVYAGEEGIGIIATENIKEEIQRKILEKYPELEGHTRDIYDEVLNDIDGVKVNDICYIYTDYETNMIRMNCVIDKTVPSDTGDVVRDIKELVKSLDSYIENGQEQAMSKIMDSENKYIEIMKDMEEAEEEW